MGEAKLITEASRSAWAFILTTALAMPSSRLAAMSSAMKSAAAAGDPRGRSEDFKPAIEMG